MLQKEKNDRLNQNQASFKKNNVKHMKLLKFKLTKPLLIALLVIFVSCNDNDVIDAPNSEEQNLEEAVNLDTTLSSQKLLEEMEKIALEIGEHATNNPLLLQEIITSMNNVNPTLDAISFASLVNDNKNILSREKNALSKRKSGISEFEKAFNISSVQKISQSDNLTKSLFSGRYQLFFPFEEKHSKGQINRLTVSFHPLNSSGKNKGYVFENGNLVEELKEVEAEYAFSNPTITIIPIVKGENEVTILESSDSVDKETRAQNRQFGRQEVTFNINPNNLNDFELVTTYIPEIKLTSNRFMDIFALGSRMILARASSDITFLPDGTIAPTASTHVYDEVWIPFWNVWFNKWNQFNRTWDPNWTIYEATQQIAVSHRKLFTIDDVNINLSVTANISASPGSPPSGDGSGTLSINTTLKINNADFISNLEVSRLDALSYNFSDDGQALYGVKNIDGRNYVLRNIGPIQYYFRNYTNDLTPTP